MIMINDNINNFIKSLSTEKEYRIILTKDCFLLIEKTKEDTGRIAFWSTLFAIKNIKLDKINRIACIDFYTQDKYYQILLKIFDLMKFKDSLLYKMSNLSIKDESKQLLRIKEIKKMKNDEIEKKIKEIEREIDDFKKIIYKEEVDEYIVNTFVILCDKAIDYFYINQNNKYLDYIDLKRDILKIKKVQNLINQPVYKTELFNKFPSLFKYYSK